MASSDVPSLVKHTFIALHKKFKSQPAKDRAISAWNVARASLVKQGYLAKGSENAPSTGLKLTSKGILRNREHRLESKNPIVDREFAELFESIEPVSPQQPEQPVTNEAKDNRKNYEQKQKADATEAVIDLLKRTKKDLKPDSKKKRKDKL